MSRSWPAAALDVLDEANAEVRSAAACYGGQRVELARAFLVAVREAYEKVVATPERWPRWALPGPELAVPRVKLAKFPHHVVYLTEPRLVVVAVMHPKREPTCWVKRM